MGVENRQPANPPLDREDDRPIASRLACGNTDTNKITPPGRRNTVICRDGSAIGHFPGMVATPISGV